MRAEIKLAMEHAIELDSLRIQRELLRAIVFADTRYQSAEIARRHNTNSATICEEAVAYDQRQRAIEEARSVFSGAQDQTSQPSILSGANMKNQTAKDST